MRGSVSGTLTAGSLGGVSDDSCPCQIGFPQLFQSLQNANKNTFTFSFVLASLYESTASCYNRYNLKSPWFNTIVFHNVQGEVMEEVRVMERGEDMILWSTQLFRDSC